jgi:hypothetical protein
MWRILFLFLPMFKSSYSHIATFDAKCGVEFLSFSSLICILVFHMRSVKCGESCCSFSPWPSPCIPASLHPMWSAELSFRVVLPLSIFPHFCILHVNGESLFFLLMFESLHSRIWCRVRSRVSELFFSYFYFHIFTFLMQNADSCFSLSLAK